MSGRSRRALLGVLGGAGWAAAVGAPARMAATPGEAPRFALGVASGFPRPDGMVLWTRLTGPGLPVRVAVRWEVAEDESFRRVVATGTEVAEADWAHSVHAEPAGLAPGRWYAYRFTALGDRSQAGRTRTAPAPGDAAPLAFAIASCQRLEHGHFAAWRDIVAAQPDLVVFLGDYIYEYGLATTRDPVRPVEGGRLVTLDDYRARYAQYRADPLLRAAHAAAPWVLTWDDHEVENDYAAATGARLLESTQDFALRRAAATQAWWEHQPLPVSARPRGSAIVVHRRLDWGRLARIHLLDNRQFRDPQACPRPGRLFGARPVRASDCAALRDAGRTLLGAAQERWLAEGWALDRPWNLLAQQTLLSGLRVRTGPGSGDREVWTDGWDGYAPARARLLQAVAARRVPGLVVLGGDTHTHLVADVHADPEDPRSPVLGAEFCGTSIASRGRAQDRLDAARADNPHLKFADARHRGSIRFRLDERALHGELRAVRDVRDAHSGAYPLASYVVEAGRAGVQPA